MPVMSGGIGVPFSFSSSVHRFPRSCRIQDIIRDRVLKGTQLSSEGLFCPIKNNHINMVHWG